MGTSWLDENWQDVCAFQITQVLTVNQVWLFEAQLLLHDGEVVSECIFYVFFL